MTDFALEFEIRLAPLVVRPYLKPIDLAPVREDADKLSDRRVSKALFAFSFSNFLT